MRVIRDGTGVPNNDLWFEMKPGRFVCAKDFEEATEFVEGAGAEGLTLKEVEERFGPVTVLSDALND